MLAIRAGDREAFGRLVESHQNRLFGLALMMLRDPAAAEETTQDAFVRAFLNLDRYDAGRPFYPWLATIAARLAQDRLRRRMRREEREGASRDPNDAPDVAADPLGDLIAAETGRRLWQSVAALPAGQRTAVFLYYRQELSVAEISSVLGVSAGTVKTLLFRARKRLRANIGGAGADGGAANGIEAV